MLDILHCSRLSAVGRFCTFIICYLPLSRFKFIVSFDPTTSSPQHPSPQSQRRSRKYANQESLRPGACFSRHCMVSPRPYSRSRLKYSQADIFDDIGDSIDDIGDDIQSFFNGITSDGGSFWSSIASEASHVAQSYSSGKSASVKHTPTNIACLFQPKSEPIQVIHSSTNTPV